VSDTQERFAEDGPARATSVSTQQFWIGALRRAGRVVNYGTPIYEREWDVLLVLDGCRVDVMQEVASDYAFLPGEIASMNSIGSMSSEWMAKNFTDEYAHETSETAYVSGNPFSSELDHAAFESVEEAWRHSWDEKYGVIKPGALTDRAITTWREQQPKRMIVHYMQPHVPFRSLIDVHPGYEQVMLLGDSGTHPKDLWNRVRDGELSRDIAWAAYRDNLRWVLDDLQLLLSNLDAERVVISSDHGNGIGEYGCYSHPAYVPLPVLKRVPWVEVSATDDRTHVPRADTRSDETVEDAVVTDRLADLGYLEPT
jgi:hypothetical protein